MAMDHYKSWSGLKKQLTDFLCDELKNRISYHLARYHDVHNAYGCASIRLDGKEMVHFSWTEMFKQERDMNDLYIKTGVWNDNSPELKMKWDNEATVSDRDFLEAATIFLQLSITEALNSENLLIQILAIMDRRVGKRTLEHLQKTGEYKRYPEWVQQFYVLRLNG